MPFTVSHAAVALPFLGARRRIEPIALTLGTLTPDIGYFCPPLVRFGTGHNLANAVLAGTLLWLVLAFFGRPLTAALPPPWRRPLHAAMRRLRGRRAALLVLPSLLLGAASHLFLDAFSHADGAAVRRIASLRRVVLELPVLGELPAYKLLQHGGTVLGLVAIAGVLLRRLPTGTWRRSVRRVVPIVAPSLALALMVAAAEAARFPAERRPAVLVVRTVVVGTSAMAVLLASASVGFWFRMSRRSSGLLRTTA